MSYLFKEGDSVYVKADQALGHIRTPFYLRGKEGVVRSIRGKFRNPEQLAYGKDGLPEVSLYCIEFDLAHVWNDRPVPAGVNKIYADIFEHWLEPR